MDIKLSINSNFPSVYLINGRLMEGGEITFNQKEVVYITVFPLDAILLPYTLKLVGPSLKCNTDLASVYSLAENKYFLKLKPRYNYVYSVSPTLISSKPKDMIERFFDYILQKKTSQARDCLSKELSDSIDNSALSSFFDGYVDIIPDDAARGLYYLTNASGKGVLFNFSIKNGLIDNIIEL